MKVVFRLSEKLFIVKKRLTHGNSLRFRASHDHSLFILHQRSGFIIHPSSAKRLHYSLKTPPDRDAAKAVFYFIRHPA